jgi:hypothetical protein
MRYNNLAFINAAECESNPPIRLPRRLLFIGRQATHTPKKTSFIRGL